MNRLEIRRERVSGWARTKSADCLVARARTAEECVEALEEAQRRGLPICPRGGGRGYADGAFDADGLVLDTSAMAGVVSWDGNRVTARAGTSMAELVEAAVSKGVRVTGVPGSPAVTVAGAIANDVHGKDSCSAGAFGRQVVAARVLTGSGEIVEAARGSELLDAVIGGLGVTGVVLEATLALQPAASAELEVTTLPVRSLEEVEAFAECADPYVFGWIDAFTEGRGWMRTARVAEAPGRKVVDRSISLARPIALAEPVLRPFFGRPSIRLANAGWRGLTRARTERVPQAQFLFVQPWIDSWNRLYGAAGVREVGLSFPASAGIAPLRALLGVGREFCEESRAFVIRRLPAEDHPLAFGLGGWIATVEFPAAATPNRHAYGHALLGLAESFGGRVYLTKDDLLDRVTFERMYPRHAEFRARKARVDPQGRFRSGLFRRLFADRAMAR